MARSVGVSLGTGLPLAAAACFWALARWFIAPGIDVDGMARGVVGPATWPRIMLYGAALCALGLFIRNMADELRGAPAAGGVAAGPGYYELRSIGLIVILLAYGAAIPQLGIAWATLAFLLAWLLVGGIRRALLLALVPTIGTVVLLYVFVKISLMPLDRGRGVFEQATLALFRLLGIY